MKSIAMKLWLAMMALVSVVLILLWLWQIVFLESYYTKERIGDLTESGFSVLQELERDNSTAFQNRLDELAYNNNLTAELLDLQLNSLYSAGSVGMNGRMPMMMMNNLRTEAFQQVIKGETVSLPLTHPRFGSDFRLIGLPVKIEGEIQGALLMTLPMAPVEDTVQILKRQLFYITWVLLASALLLSYLLARNFTKPILQITKTAMAMAAGNLSARIQTTRQDEIGKLGDTINYLGQELSKIEQLRKDLIANVSHELRTPLSLIKGYAETIRDVSGANQEKRDKQIGIIIEEADRLSSIVEDILNLSQMEAGYSSLSISKFPIQETLLRVSQKYELLSEASQVALKLESSVQVMVEADEKRIEQVLFNLINNAFNHSRPGDSITVSASEDDSKVIIKVADTGEGIPEADLPQIWDRFYKAAKSGQRQKSGTGLGLAIVKSILTSHGFAFGVESRVGQGTTFSFELRKAR